MCFSCPFQGDCDNVTKLEKADILELTVRHLHTLRRQNKLFASANVAYADRFRAGFTHCAAEVSQFLNKIDQNANAHLMRHLRDCIQRCEPPTPPPPPVLRISSPPIPIDVPQPYYPIGAAAAAAVVAVANKMNQIAKVADLPNIVAGNNNNNNKSTNNNNYLTTSYNNTSSPNGSNAATNDPDNRPVLIKQSISPMLNKDDPQQLNGDVWRPW